jgi:uncharacterized membrane protein SirB2
VVTGQFPASSVNDFRQMNQYKMNPINEVKTIRAFPPIAKTFLLTNVGLMSPGLFRVA